mmetsp:Transcript_20096/g.76956  ORF Transcript_20096/g.76956 Transcript_20096/m.76956 type:complete len:200 (-) Transcript_20096:754-1353(-)
MEDDELTANGEVGEAETEDILGAVLGGDEEGVGAVVECDARSAQHAEGRHPLADGVRPLDAQGLSLSLSRLLRILFLFLLFRFLAAVHVHGVLPHCLLLLLLLLCTLPLQSLLFLPLLFAKQGQVHDRRQQIERNHHVGSCHLWRKVEAPQRGVGRWLLFCVGVHHRAVPAQPLCQHSCEHPAAVLLHQNRVSRSHIRH